jgi:Radical SAM superfamily
MITVPKLEMHLAHACNLRCTGCSHYSDHALSGIVELEEGSRWLRDWGARIHPVRFSFLGGEPLLNRDVPEFLLRARSIWPGTHVRLVTNGLLLHRWEQLWPALATTRTTLTISVHSVDPRYLARLRPNLALVRTRSEQHGFRYETRDSIHGWYKLYQNEGPAMEPFTDGDPESSWAVCANKHCVTLQDDALWKCPPLAHLPRVARRQSLTLRASWEPYLRYRPLTLDATDDDIRAFFGRGPERYCGMCPSKLTYFEKSPF